MPRALNHCDPYHMSSWWFLRTSSMTTNSRPTSPPRFPVLSVGSFSCVAPKNRSVDLMFILSFGPGLFMNCIWLPSLCVVGSMTPPLVRKDMA